MTGHPARRRDDRDPEGARFEALLARLVRGELTEPEEEELALYAEGDDARAAALSRARKMRDLGGAWLRRVEDDRALATLEHRRSVRLERGVGVALLVGAVVVGLVSAEVGAGLMAAGTVTLLWSFLRTAFAARTKDPYRDVQE